MDLNNGPSRSHRRKSTSTDRFLCAFPHTLPPGNSFSSSAAATSFDEFNEDDIVWNDDFTAETSHHHHNYSTSPSSTSSTPRHNLHRDFAQPESFGILAALPENETSDDLQTVSHFYHKKSISISSSSSSSSSSSRIIPSIRKPPMERMAIAAKPSRTPKYQSAPVNVPVLSNSMRRPNRFDVNDDEEQGDGEMLPPHEIVARSLAKSPALACSVLEGAGRTLKGRDLRQVRNAVFRQTGFIHWGF